MLTSLPQVSRGKDGAENRNFIFSCWDADKTHNVGWKAAYNMNNGSGCSRFGGEGVGSHCLLRYPIKENVVYNFRVFSDGKNATHAFWTGVVVPKNGDPKVTVGTLCYPHILDPKTGKQYPGGGFGNFNVQSDDFLEYFGGGAAAAAFSRLLAAGR